MPSSGRRRRSRAAEMSDWDRQFAMLKHPGLTHEDALGAERAAAEAELGARMWDELIPHRTLRRQELESSRAAARRRAEQAKAATRYAAEAEERTKRNRGAIFPWRATVFIFLPIVVLVAPYWGK